MSKQRKIPTVDERDQGGDPAKRRINITEPRDLQALAVELGCTREKLRIAVEQVGNVVSDVANFLKGETLRSTHDDKAQAAAALHSLFER